MNWLPALFSRRKPPLRLHVGSGSTHLAGWINVDRERLPGVDRVIDVRRGLPWKSGSAELIFSEHFIEHLTFTEGLAFLRECRRVLQADGILRVSTPNLDWVYETQYHPRSWSTPDEPVRDCFSLNRGFRGWGHQFLYNLPALTATLEAAGFRDVVPCLYGESEVAALRGLEVHEKYVDAPELPHVIIAEATGRGTTGMERIKAAKGDYEEVVNL